MKHPAFGKWLSSPKFLVISGLVACTIVGSVSFLLARPAHAPEKKAAITEGPITLEGTVVCLPHRDTSGPQTLECAYGLKTADSTYYALRDASADHSMISRLGTDQHVRVNGSFKSEPSEKYQAIGTISIESVEVLTE